MENAFQQKIDDIRSQIEIAIGDAYIQPKPVVALGYIRFKLDEAIKRVDETLKLESA